MAIKFSPGKVEIFETPQGVVSLSARSFWSGLSQDGKEIVSGIGIGIQIPYCDPNDTCYNAAGDVISLEDAKKLRDWISNAIDRLETES